MDFLKEQPQIYGFSCLRRRFEKNLTFLMLNNVKNSSIIIFDNIFFFGLLCFCVCDSH